MSVFKIADVLLMLDCMMGKHFLIGNEEHAIRESRKIADLISKIKICNRRSPLGASERHSKVVSHFKRQLSGLKAVNVIILAM